MAQKTGQRWIDWGGDGPLLHFAHANGFPSATYRVLLHDLRRDFHVVSSQARPMWDPGGHADVHGWQQLADDLVDVLDEHAGEPVIGVGHSLGGAMTILAAARRPDLFSAIVPVDPLTLCGIPALVWRGMKLLGLRHRLPLVKGALARRHRWPDPEVARRAYANKPAFRSWRREVFDDYIDAAFVPTGDGDHALRYPREWEARIFAVSPANTFAAMRRIECPGLFVRGETSNAFLAGSVAKIRRCNPRLDVVTIPRSSHFVPMEHPEQVARAIRTFCRETDSPPVTE